MADQRETLPWLSGFSLDSSSPRLHRYLPRILPAEGDRAILYQHGLDEVNGANSSADAEVQVSKIGNTITFGDPLGQEGGAVTFPDSGFELWTDPKTGDYTYTIYPKFAVESDFINGLEPAAWYDVIGEIDSIYPRISVTRTHPEYDDIDPFVISLSINLIPEDLVVVSGEEFEAEIPDTISFLDNPAADHFDFWIGTPRVIKIEDEAGTHFFRPAVVARMPRITGEVMSKFDEFADYRNPDLERKREDLANILSLVQATVTLEAFDPFGRSGMAQASGGVNE